MRLCACGLCSIASVDLQDCDVFPSPSHPCAFEIVTPEEPRRAGPQRDQFHYTYVGVCECAVCVLCVCAVCVLCVCVRVPMQAPFVLSGACTCVQLWSGVVVVVAMVVAVVAVVVMVCVCGRSYWLTPSCPNPVPFLCPLLLVTGQLPRRVRGVHEGVG
jgi:hypothetical protein